jgi:hypothetical protein
VSHHVSAEDLASLDLDALKPRKASRVRAHVHICAQCTQLSGQVSAVPTTLASVSVSYQAMPDSLSARLDAAIASESAQRLAAAPASEAGRRDLPDRSSRARQQRHGWQLPGLSVLGTRLVAAAGALVIVGAGGYEIAANVGGTSNSGTAATSNGAAAVPSPETTQLSLGATVSYGVGGSHKTIRTVSSDMNFEPSRLAGEAVAAVRAARLRGAVEFNGTAVPGASAAASASDKTTRSSLGSTLAGCLDRIAGNQSVLLVETAKYAGRPATIIVTASSAKQEAQVWVVAPACSASHPDVLDHLRLSRT